MGVISDAAESRGDFGRRQAETERDLAQARTARRGQATSIGAGGLRLHSGGSLRVDGGGDVGVHDGGRLYAAYPSGARGAFFGPLIDIVTGDPVGHGLLVQADGPTPADQTDILIASHDTSSKRVVYIGQPGGGGPVHEWESRALDSQHHAYTRMRLQSHDDADIEILSDERLWLYGDDAVDIACPNGDVGFLVGGDTIVLPSGGGYYGGADGVFLQPTAGAGNAAVRMDSASGRITYVIESSTARVKDDITDLDIDPAAVLRMRPRTWRPKPTVQVCPDWVHGQHADGDECHAGETCEPPPGREVGFVAEELDELGLSEFVGYDDAGLPASIHYDRLTAAVIPLLKRQQEQIESLAARVAAIENREERSDA